MTYEVQPGDTLWAIATRFGVSVQDLVAVNRLTNPGTLYVGQRLLIPTASASPSAAPSPSGSRALEDRVAVLEKNWDQLVAIVDHHRVQIADLGRRLRALEQQPK